MRWLDACLDSALAQTYPAIEFIVLDNASTDGTTSRLPLTGPYQDDPNEGQLWEYTSATAKVQVMDGCELGGAYWVVAAALTEQPLQVAVTDPETGASATFELAPEEEGVARVADTSSLSACS